MRFASLLVGALLMACASPGRFHSTRDPAVLARYTAKMACSCLFVAGQTEDFCRKWVRYEPDFAAWTADHDLRTVDVGAVLFWHARARYVSDHDGCRLE
jgi:hypothetical protein